MAKKHPMPRTSPTDGCRSAISTAIISLARSLQLKTVAEGIETGPQLDFLRDHGCDQGQGYLFGKPLPAAQFADLLANWGKAKHY